MGSAVGDAERRGRGGLAALGLSALVAGCFVDPGPIPAQESEGSTTTTTTTTMSLPTTSTTSMSATTDASSGTGAPECVDDTGCEIGEVCQDGACVLGECAPTAIPRVFAPPAIVFVVDKSRSMVLNVWDDDADPMTATVTRWSTIHGALVAAAAEFEGLADFGLKLFPDLGVPASYTAAACAVAPAVDVAVTPEGGGLLASVLPSADADPMSGEIAGGTPAAAGLATALAHLAEIAATSPERPRFVLMTIDGAANCRADAADDNERFETYDASVIAQAAAGLAAGSPVAVVGVDISAALTPVMVDGQPDGANNSALLDELALAGGMANSGGMEAFFNTHDGFDVDKSIGRLLERMTCTVLTARPHPDALLQGLSLGGSALPMVDLGVCDDVAGWADAGGGRLRLCGAACGEFQVGGELLLDFTCGA